MKKFKNILWGIVLIAIGIILGLNALNITNVNILFNGWWTLFIIVPCFIGLFGKEQKTGNIIGLIIGIMLLLGARRIIRLEMIMNLIFPTILIIIGVSSILKDTINSKVNEEIKKINSKNKGLNEYSAVFSGQDIKPNSEKFNGANLNAIFGKIKFDLKEVTLDEDQVINCYSIFGGIDIFVPENVNVQIRSNSIFGGVENKINNKGNEKTIYINAVCMFGGVDIK